MKTLLRGALMSAILLGAMANTAVAVPAPLPPDVRYLGKGTWLVAPHNSSPDDPQRIQATVNLAAPGDTIRLGAGTFDFREFETVRVAKDLTIEGAWDGKRDTPLTTIKGGFIPIMIGRKTPVEKPAQVDVDGHPVYLLTPDIHGKLHFPFLYPPYTAPGAPPYDVFTDWAAARVNVRQIRFERPFADAIMAGAQNGGVIERNVVDSMWPPSLDIENIRPLGIAFNWMSMGLRPMVTALWGLSFDSRLYTGTDLMRGDIKLQNNLMNGDYRGIPEGEPDEAGDIVTLPFDPLHPSPPGNAYAKYYLQAVGFDAMPGPNSNPAESRTYWVKKGYTAFWYTGYDGRVWADRGMFYGVYSAWSEAKLTIRENAFNNVEGGIYFIANGYRGKPFNVSIERNSFDIANNTGVLEVKSALIAGDWTLPNNVTGDTFGPDPGTNLTFSQNDVRITSPGLNGRWWGNAVDVEVAGKAVIEKNRVALASGNGIGVWGPTQKAVVANNQVSGQGDYALLAYWGADGNTFRGNNVNRFDPNGLGMPAFGQPPAHVILFSNRNTVIGGGKHDGGTVLDLGVDNNITGMTRQTGKSQTDRLIDRLTAPMRKIIP
jgi:hypothetical protein